MAANLVLSSQTEWQRPKQDYFGFSHNSAHRSVQAEAETGQQCYVSAVIQGIFENLTNSSDILASVQDINIGPNRKSSLLIRHIFCLR